MQHTIQVTHTLSTETKPSNFYETLDIKVTINVV